VKKASAKRAPAVAKKTPAKKAVARKAAKAPRRKAAFVLRLYIAGATARSQQAILRARELCNTQLNGDYELEVIDIYQQPLLARDGQILATPTLVKTFPPPVRRLIGNLSDCTGFFVGLDLTAKGSAAS
jgi:circadian clock protein KaiB